MRLALGLALRIVVLILISGAACAHDRQADGTPVPAWIKHACCGPEDYHVLKPSQVHEKADGWHVDGYHDVLPYGTEMPSEDGTYAIFYIEYQDGTQSRAFCFFVPPRGF